MPWKLVSDGLVVSVRLTPKGGRDAIDGIGRLGDGQSVLFARVRAAASEGEANAALRHLIARALQVAPGRVTLLAGATSRIKRLLIEGAGPLLATALSRLTQGKRDDREAH